MGENVTAITQKVVAFLRPRTHILTMAGHRFCHTMNYRIDDRDLSAFLVYAARERSLDASLRAANKYGRSDEHKKSIDALRELNKKMLFRETRRDIHPF